MTTINTLSADAARLNPVAVWPQPKPLAPHPLAVVAAEAQAPTPTHEVTFEATSGARLTAVGSFDDNGEFTGVLSRFGDPLDPLPPKFSATVTLPDARDPNFGLCVPPLARNEMGAANAVLDEALEAYDQAQAEVPESPAEVQPENPATLLPLAAVELTDAERAEVVAMVVEEGFTEDEARCEVLAARPLSDDAIAEQVALERALQITGKFSLAEAPAPATRQARVHRRPTCDRLFADFTRPGRLTDEQLQDMKRRCASESGFRSALFEYIAAAAVRRPSLAHEYRYPHPKTLVTLHQRWRELHGAGDGAAYAGGQPIYDALTAATLYVPL